MHAGHPIIAALLDRPDRAGLVMDFDGVLAPIVDDPATSRLLPTTAELLEDLAGHLGVVALVSGRPVSFLAEHAGIDGVTLLGSYGVESWHCGRTRVLPEVERWRGTVAQVSTELHDQFDPVDGVHVEDKGLAVAVHWRQAPDRGAAQRLVETAVATAAADTGLHREPGKFVAELRPPVQQDKGTAIRRLVGEAALECVVYAGDDLGDVPAFNVVTELGGHTLAVIHGAETAAAVTAAAETTIDGVEGFRAWLRELRDALHRHGARG